ncbi:CPBP family intramembrane metalloprotease, partial [Romboutsia weinsteinii]
MCSDIKVIKKEVNAFLLINFGLIALVSVFIFISTTKANSASFISNFAVLFMYIPAFSVIVVLKRISNYSFSSRVDKFFRVFAITTLARIVISIVEVLLIGNIFISSIVDTIVSCYLVFVVFIHGSDFEVLNLSLIKNFKKVLSVILIFLVITIVGSIPSFLSIKSNPIDIANNTVIASISLVINLFFGFNLFFGEEFGWRYFLQPRLQKLYGKRFGVIILGFIWGIWHLPLCITLYSPETPLYCIISHVSFCTFLGIFLGYAYMKTKNLWTPILIHLVNNSLAVILGGGYETIFTPEALFWGIIGNAIIFLPFLLTKEYK